MNTVSTTTPSLDWHGPGARASERRSLTWHSLLWTLVFPKKRHRIALTVPGLFLMALAMGIGSAAYNTASNILFITLSLLLACLLLSGLLSWFNFMDLSWRLRPQGAWRAGHETLVTVEVRNGKRWLPTYSLWFELATQPRRIPEPEVPAGRELKMREILAAAEKHITRGRLDLRERIEPGGTVTLEWGVKPLRRGEARVELTSVGSLFPFGFLRKNLGTEALQPVLVWPAQIEYTWNGGKAAHSGAAGQRTSRAGAGDDLLALRRYQQGDSHRLIHWKASARLGRLMIRQFAAESHDGYVLCVDPAADLWPRPEQFELLCSLAGTLAEDLFATGRLRAVSLQGGAWREIRRLRDVEAWLDELARLEPVAVGARATSTAARTEVGAAPLKTNQNVITFAPEGARGVAAHVNGHKTASA
ncbi:hypothetical protein Verru16b_03572 [Lacunisphaera limnophila]|uniref:DUF58 domain-containing protein n=1 Tax=Lacunisphaera limnophila TaxID=1838286 RepID=A0A1D8AZZ9_9BACT|nr:DUF58 domain-containing protein [Lacunisphaera limnophila]AOS46466.1 hypothetical protein Verru16b_03572 [Lacunisphaera limnophila]